METKGAIHESILCCSALLILAATSPHLAHAGVLAEYFFAEGGGNVATDSSGNGNNGTITGATYLLDVSDTVFGDGALEFLNIPSPYTTPATDYMTIPDSPSLRPANSLIIEAWVKAYPYGNTQGRCIVSKNCAGMFGQTSYILYYENAGGWIGNVAFGLYDGPRAVSIFTPFPPVGEWHNIKAEWDGSTMRLYVDGWLGASLAHTAPIEYDGSPVYIGTQHFSDTTRSGWYGLIDQVVIRTLNDPPVAIITSPPSGLIAAVNDWVFFDGLIDDPDEGDVHTAVWRISGENLADDIVVDGTVSGDTVSDAYQFTDAGVYSVKLTVTDESGASDVATTVDGLEDMPAYVVVYDPDGGFVTGGGWIYSPPGSLSLDPSAEGRASFGFVAKYKKGATTPQGNTEFRFQAGQFRFKSTSYEWLVIAGSKAMFKGEGSIDGMAGSYKFMLTAVDSTEDRFRIKIWDPDTDQVIYDNKRGAGDEAEPTIIGGGSIVIHRQ